MMIDFIFILLLAMAAWKGFRKGLIMAVFSFVAFFIGLAAALKFSTIVASWLKNTTGSGAYWLPFLSFALIIIGVAFLVRLGGNMIEKTASALMLGMLNRLGGFILFALIYLLLYSIVLFYAKELHLISPATIEASHTYNIIAPWGPACIEGLGKIIPWFRGLFDQLQDFFGRLATEQSKPA